MEHETKDQLKPEADPLSVQVSAQDSGKLKPAPSKQNSGSSVPRGWTEFRSMRGDYLFRRVRNKGKPGRGPLVMLRWLPNRRPVLEVGIVVSKKVGKAVVRNTVRRRLREAMRRSNCPAAQVLIIATPEAAGASYAKLVHSLSQAMRKSGLEWQPL